VQTSLDPRIQTSVRQAVRTARSKFDHSRGCRGAITRINISGDWGIRLAEVTSLTDIAPSRLAVVLVTSEPSARISFQPARESGSIVKTRDSGRITLDGIKWARAAKDRTPPAMSQILTSGRGDRCRSPHPERPDC